MLSIPIGSLVFDNTEKYYLSHLSSVQSLNIANNKFRSVQTFKIEGLNRLGSLIIGKNSFTQSTNSFGNRSMKSFHILNCESLTYIRIGEYSFSDFGGVFELKNLSKLRTIQFGAIMSVSNNFYSSSFVIRGSDIIDCILIRSS